MPDLKIENSLNCIVAGVDEAGRGPLCGPVVAAAVILNKSNIPNGLDDSKKLTAKKRELLFEQIKASSIVGVGIVWQNIIDKINILQATKKAMAEAVNKLSQLPKKIIVDGNQKFNAGTIEVIPIIKGDSISLSISAASIIAKVSRDRIMEELHNEAPHYNWQKNAGYGTREHLEAIEKFGISKYHRKSFAPIKHMEEDRY
ncbi:MAG TPA: ribonuclease HII [Alphaproteobacteria bacterium]|nr:ribonuclease HII [Alphaproteobacteria bacterium]